MNIIGMWGVYLVFRVDSKYLRTFRDLTVDTGERWATHDIYMGEQLAEYLGPAPTSFKMTIDVIPQGGKTWKPRELAERLRRHIKNGDGAPLIIGGKIMSQYDVRLSSLSEKWERIDGSGKLSKLTADVTFTEIPGGRVWTQ